MLLVQQKGGEPVLWGSHGLKEQGTRGSMPPRPPLT